MREMLYLENDDHEVSAIVYDVAALKSRMRGGIFGVAIGDALGVPVEFIARATLEKNLVIGYRAMGTHHQPAGTYSDDTALTLCLLESLSTGLNYTRIAENFIAWRNRGKWSATGTVFSIGNTTRDAISALERGVEPTQAGPKTEKSNGNGALMRILPLAFFTLNQGREKRRQAAFAVSAMTHGHPRSQIASWFYCEIIGNILLGQAKADAVDNAVKLLETHLDGEWKTAEWQNFSRCSSRIGNLQSTEIRSSGYVIDSLEAALYCFLTTDSLTAAVLKAVNLGDDSDTVGAITGGLAGCFYSETAIPDSLVQPLQRKDDIRALCDRFIESLPFQHDDRDF